MKNIEKGSIKYLIYLIVAIFIFSVILYPLFDIIFCKFIVKTEFVYTVQDYVLQPLLSSVICGLIIWAVDRKKK